MSWTDNIQSKLIITTGDGKNYSPLWKNSCAKEIEYNIAQFDFPKVEGSLINRGTPTARKFNLEIAFQGDSNWDDALDFEISARDPRPWKISHPIFGRILVQPAALKFDYTAYNLTLITGVIFETIGGSGTSSGPRIVVLPSDKIAADQAKLNGAMATQCFNGITPSVKDSTTLSGLNLALYNYGVKALKTTEDAGAYLNVFNAAAAAINEVISDASHAVTFFQNMINFPALMVTTIQSRLDILQSQFDFLHANVIGITKRSDKRIYETSQGTLVASMCRAAVTSYDSSGNLVVFGSLPDYTTRSQVITVIDLIQSAYQQYLTDLDDLQTDNGGGEDSYVADGDSIMQMNALVNFTLSNLANIAQDAKQQRSVVLEEDSNAIILTHRFYGLLVDDSTLDTFIQTNNIFLNELLQIRKGRTLIYFI